MHKKILTIVGITILFLGTCITPTYAIDNVKKSSIPIIGNTLYVGGDGPDNYTKIQDAINNASNSDTVFVYHNSSPYYEHVIINKSINLIGEHKNSTIIDGNFSGDVIDIKADWVTVRGFTLKYGYRHGIDIYSNYSTITGNTILNNLHNGIDLCHSNSNNITSNTILNNYRQGIYLLGSNSNTITGNTISNNRYDGIGLSGSSNIISSNNINSNNKNGISLYNNYNIITGNTISSNNEYGVYLLNSIFNFILKNNFIDNELDAFFKNRIIYLLSLRTNRWNENYWNESRILPKLIIGELYWEGTGMPQTEHHITWFPQIDWRPAKEPYDIKI